MKKRRLLLLVAGVFLMGLLAGVLVSPSGQVAAQSCPATYVVEPGDTLFRIAVRYQTSIPVLMSMNSGNIINPNVIYYGQTLCVPAGESESAVSVEASYEYKWNTDELAIDLVPRNEMAGKRLEFPLAYDAIDTYEDREAIFDELEAANSPVFVAVRQGKALSYTMVTIGNVDLFTDLRIEGAATFTETATVLEALGDEDGPVVDASLRFWLEGGNGLRYPFDVFAVDVAADLAALSTNYGETGSPEIGFALVPVGSGEEYRVIMLLTEGEFGPPGRRWRQRCTSWGGQRGFVYGWLRWWYGC